ncbi:hypothetical protein [Microtetraspora sp. NBRC 16547]|uniref:hypothetical protein n=1 Tax=Microtetraspora sp. NBRC 16547 TaxID=3030993 RepID=UPI00255700DA|nr:hypothetical protein [Microtetraspora sp. NBRC 16547]
MPRAPEETGREPPARAPTTGHDHERAGEPDGVGQPAEQDRRDHARAVVACATAGRAVRRVSGATTTHSSTAWKPPNPRQPSPES